MVIKVDSSGAKWQRVVQNGRNALFNPINEMGGKKTIIQWYPLIIQK